MCSIDSGCWERLPALGVRRDGWFCRPTWGWAAGNRGDDPCWGAGLDRVFVSLAADVRDVVERLEDVEKLEPPPAARRSQHETPS